MVDEILRIRNLDTSRNYRALDLFSGAGGTTVGATNTGVVDVVAAVDSWDLACKTYADNNPDTVVYNAKCEDLDPSAIKKHIGSVDFLLASPECTNHSCAKGNSARSDESRNTAFEVLRYASTFMPKWIVIENVIQMRRWKRYEELLNSLSQLGYFYEPIILNSTDFDVPQSRKRLFLVAGLGRRPAVPTPSPNSTRPAAREFIDTNGAYSYSVLRSDGRAQSTIQRAERAIANVASRHPFLIVYYGNDGSGGWQSVNVPLRTVTTLDRFAYVRYRDGRYEMRMLQVPELKRAMGFPTDYRFDQGVRRDRIKLLGNAVCPPVMTGIITSILDKHHSLM